mmetsp:Transcript_32269/g.80930  ORF Transcript_32269/g.80930 Transcript_32269/m.80930 type:complete len:230 (+) Transcript_32269:901-1590(+)
MRVVMTPPTVSMPRVRGMTSRRTMLSRCFLPSPLRIPPWMAAPYATASSGLMPRLGSLPSKNCLRSSWTLGMRVEPPTSTISSMSDFLSLASSSTLRTGPRVFLNRSMFSSSKRARVRVSMRSLPPWKFSISMRAWMAVDKERFARSTSLFSFWMARLSLDASRPVFFLKTLRKWVITRWSKSSPPRWVSPLVARASKTPSSMVRTDTSKVPPPRSYTRMFCSPFLSRP